MRPPPPPASVVAIHHANRTPAAPARASVTDVDRNDALTRIAKYLQFVAAGEAETDHQEQAIADDTQPREARDRCVQQVVPNGLRRQRSEERRVGKEGGSTC